MQAIPWPIEKRCFSNLSIPCNRELHETVKKEIGDLCLRLLEQADASLVCEADCDRVLSVQFSAFPYFDFSGDKSLRVDNLLNP
jgi:hypothetical protein